MKSQIQTEQEKFEAREIRIAKDRAKFHEKIEEDVSDGRQKTL